MKLKRRFASRSRSQSPSLVTIYQEAARRIRRFGAIMDESNSISFDNQPEPIFQNQLIVTKIQSFFSLVELRELRLVNKLWNFVASEFLYCRKNATKKLDRIDNLTQFLKTMKNRLESMPIFSAFNLVVAQISDLEIQQFGTEFQNWVNVLNFELLNSFEDVTPVETRSRLLKTIWILAAFPNVAEVKLEYSENSEENCLTSSDLTTLPGSFLGLKFLHFVHIRKQVNYKVCGPRPPCHPIATCFWYTILARAPNLTRIQVERVYDAHISPSVQQLPVTLTKFPTPPALVLLMSFGVIGTGTGNDDERHHFQLLQNFARVGYKNFRVLNVYIISPTSDSLAAFNNFLALQAPMLESLKIAVYSNRRRGGNILKIPPMGNLSILEVKLQEWSLRQIRPRFFLKNFPKLHEIQIKKCQEVAFEEVELQICGSST